MRLPLMHLIVAGIGRLRRPAFDARAATELARFGLPFFPATRYALAPSALLAVVNDILINRRLQVLELGSGCSSIVIAKALEKSGGLLFTVDHDETWLGEVMKMAEAAGVRRAIRPIHAPLGPGRDGGVWYEAAMIRSALKEGGVDFLLVDGPPAGRGRDKRARAPALGELGDLLSQNCAIVLDDIHRPSHAAIAKEWGERLGLNFTLVHARGGFAYAARGPAFDPIM